MKHRFFALAAACSLLLSACSVQTGQSEKDAMSRLESLAEGANTDAIKSCFDWIMSQTIEGYDKAYEFNQSVHEENVVEENGSLISVESYQDTVVMQWMDEDKALYQVMRNGSVDGQPPYAGFVRMNKEATTTISADMVNNADVFGNPLDVRVQYISVLENKALKDASDEQVGYRLISQELQQLTPYFGSGAAITPYSNPRLFSFAVQKENDEVILTITLKDPDAYNDRASETDGLRQDILRSSKVKDVQAKTDALTWILHMDDNGILNEATMDTLESVEKNGTTVQLHSTRSGTLHGCSSNKDIGTLKDLFEQADDGSIKQGSCFTIDLPLVQEVSAR